jgi:hypothetical protein
VAGISNEEFASTMRILPFPFADAASSTTLEIYHGAHGAWETNSPIRAFLPYELNGEKVLVASYLCTPLVTFSLDKIKDKQHVKGRTLAELGYGNYPLDMVAYEKGGKGFILLINSARGVMRFSAETMAAYEGELTEELSTIQAGLPFDPLPGTGVQQLDNYGKENLAMLVRQPNGQLDLALAPTRRL